MDSAIDATVPDYAKIDDRLSALDSQLGETRATLTRIAGDLASAVRDGAAARESAARLDRLEERVEGVAAILARIEPALEASARDARTAAVDRMANLDQRLEETRTAVARIEPSVTALKGEIGEAALAANRVSADRLASLEASVAQISGGLERVEAAVALAVKNGAEITAARLDMAAVRSQLIPVDDFMSRLPSQRGAAMGLIWAAVLLFALVQLGAST